MHVIFSELPSYAAPIARLIRWFGCEVYYLRLSGAENESGSEVEEKRANRLKSSGITPLPLEFLPRFSGFSECDSDPQRNAFKKACELAPLLLRKSFEQLFPDNKLVSEKLQIVVHSHVASLQIFVAGKVRIWAAEHPDQKIVLVSLNHAELLMPDLADNVRHVVVPAELFLKAVRGVSRVLRMLLERRRETVGSHQRTEPFSLIPKDAFGESRVVFVTHKGLSYGSLFQKVLYYSTDPLSNFFRGNLLHFDYCGCPSPSRELKWICLNAMPGTMVSQVRDLLRALRYALPAVRSWCQFIGCLALSRAYVRYKAFCGKLEAFPSLRIAIIDYEVLCPKELLLAFEARGIGTVATQERFILAFYASGVSAIVDRYLCCSQYAAEKLAASSCYCVEHYTPVGQYRSDNFAKFRQESLPEILRRPKEQGKRIVTVLGYHAHLRWYQSQSDPLLNWSAHRQFLEEMIQLSRDIHNVFVILRFKFVNWVSLPVFTEVIREIESSKNMAISMDYEKSFFSYDLCANSQLVIAKHTSLGDECLAAGIPVLFHEYAHNTERLVADAFDYSPARIMCFNYQEILERSKAVLRGDSAMMSDYEYLRSVVYGGLGDGKVQKRIHAHIDSLLRDDLSGSSTGHSSAVDSGAYSH